MDFSGAMITTYRFVVLREFEEPGGSTRISGHVMTQSGILQQSEMTWTLLG